jgi:hypothetical protein
MLVEDITGKALASEVLSAIIRRSPFEVMVLPHEGESPDWRSG